MLRKLFVLSLVKYNSSVWYLTFYITPNKNAIKNFGADNVIIF